MWKLMAGGLALTMAAPAAAQVSLGGGISITGEASATTDYRFRGISQTDGDPALQGYARIDHNSGIHVAAFVSTLDDVSRPGQFEARFDVGFSREILLATNIDVGVQYYAFPDNDGVVGASFFEPYVAVSHTLGPVTAEVGAAYAPAQDAFGDEDSVNLYADARAGLIILPFSVTGRVSHTSGPARFVGALGARDYWDWRVGAERTFGPATIAIEYVDTNLPDTVPQADATLVATLRLGF